MNPLSIRTLSLLFLGLLLPATAAPGVSITINPGVDTSYVLARVDGLDGEGDETVDEPTALSSGTPTAERGAGEAAETAYTLSNDAFTFSFDHTRLAAASSLAYSEAVIYFSPDTDVEYVVSGAYSAIDADGRVVALALTLQSLGVDYSSAQVSESTPNESFMLGLEEGDSSNYLSGSPIGTLTAGEIYQLVVVSWIQSPPGGVVGSGGATATGSLSLTFVPEPTTALLLGIGLAGFAVRRQINCPPPGVTRRA